MNSKLQKIFDVHSHALAENPFTSALNDYDFEEASTDVLRLVLGDINWPKLREQKQNLLLITENCDESSLVESLTGILHLIDSLQDSAVEFGISTEEEVFGESVDVKEQTLEILFEIFGEAAKHYQANTLDEYLLNESRITQEQREQILKMYQ